MRLKEMYFSSDSQRRTHISVTCNNLHKHILYAQRRTNYVMKHDKYLGIVTKRLG